MSNFTHQRYPDEPIDVLHVEDDDGDVRLAREAFVPLVTAIEAFWLEHARLPPSSS